MNFKIPLVFITERCTLTWRDIDFGMKHQLLETQAPIQLANHRINQGCDRSNSLLQLASSCAGESIIALLDELATSEPRLPEWTIRDKWLFIVLAWLYAYRRQLTDPLAIIEEVYADFDYPPKMAGFVRYIPMDGPDLGSPALNEERLMTRWKLLIDEEREKYSPEPQPRSDTAQSSPA